MKLNQRIKKISVMIFLSTLAVFLIAIAAIAQTLHTMNYQGFLTDSSGIPLNGSYNLVFTLYDAESAGNLEWGPETHNNVQIVNGIFQVALGSITPLYTNDFDEPLFLAVSVNGEAMSSRQALRSVPYAFGLVPGAEVQGDPLSGQYGLSVDNTGTGVTDRGLYARGEQYGIYAEEVGSNSDVGIYSPDFIHGEGFRSNADSYLWVPATAAMLYPSSGCTLYPSWHGSVRLECSTPGQKAINIPITVPGVLFGQNVRVRDIQVHYDLDNSGSYIDSTRLHKLTGAGSSISLITDSTNHMSTSPASYTLSPTDDEIATLDATAGALNLNLGIYHDGDLNHDVIIGGVRIRLRHYPIP